MHTFRTAITSAALTTLTLGLVVVAAPAASAEPSPAELCALATASTVGKLQSSGALEGLEVQGIPAKDIPPALAAQAARTKLNCGAVPQVDPAKAKAAVCTQLTVTGLRAFASRLGASPESQGKITETRVKKARTALECDKVGATPTPTSTPKPTPTPTSPTSSPKPTGSSTPQTTTSSSTTTQARGGTTTTTKPGAPGGSYQVDLDCKDFPTQAAAQKAFDNDRSDPHNLDRDGDGFACELGGGTGTGAGGNGTVDSGDYIGAGSYGQVGDGDVPIGSIATGGQ
jgi:hypothetical protein